MAASCAAGVCSACVVRVSSSFSGVTMPSSTYLSSVNNVSVRNALRYLPPPLPSLQRSPD